MDTRIELQAFNEALVVLGALAVTCAGLVIWAGSDEPAMSFHGALFCLAGLAGGGYVLTTLNNDRAAAETGYFDGPFKVATIAAIVWGIAGFVIGDILAWQLALPMLNLDLPWTSFGRSRPLHTSAVIFAFGGNVLIATSFYVVQRTSHARLAGRWSPWFVVWGY